MKIRQKNGKWINSQVFREEALKFKKNKYYTSAYEGSPSYIKYWEEQMRRCKEGYEVGGEKITGFHYAYLNFHPIKIVEVGEEKTANKVVTLPDFWDGDYDYFWSLEIARNGIYNSISQVPTTEADNKKYDRLNVRYENIKDKKSKEAVDIKKQINKMYKKALDKLNLRVKPHYDYLDGGHHLIVGKSRRKGYSYKNGAMINTIYHLVKGSISIICTFKEDDYKPMLSMVNKYVSSFTKNTAWGKTRDYIDKNNHKRASYKKIVNGKPIQSGYLSEFYAVGTKDNPDRLRGTDAKLVVFEEAGKFPNLEETYNATKPALEAGIYTTGQMVIFGTGGDMEKGTVAFCKMFYNPEIYNIMPFWNIWDKDAENTTCGFFHPVYMNFDGCYDEQGNSDIEKAKNYQIELRDKIIKGSSDSKAYQQHVQEYPFAPEEAFLNTSSNMFPTRELDARLKFINREGITEKMWQPVELYYEKGKVKIKHILDGSANPIYTREPPSNNIEGCITIKEFPIPNAPKGLYKIGYDPVRHDEGVSLCSILVYKSNNNFSYTRDSIVAEFYGRKATTEQNHEIAEKLAILYNAEIMHENEVPDVSNYFRRRKKLHLLAYQPDEVITANIKNSKVKRTYGIHMNDRLKDAGEKYIDSWLRETREFQNGTEIRNLDTLTCRGLLEELIAYKREGNFDRVMAFMMLMFQIEEENLGKVKVYGKENNPKIDLGVLFDKQRKKWRAI